MKNPFIQRLSLLLLYLIWWILPGGIHFFVLSKFYPSDQTTILNDALISFSIFAILGLSIWWMVRYSNISQGLDSKTLWNHFWAMLLLFILWTGISLSLISLFSLGYYILFLETMLWRALIFLPFYFILIIVYYLFASADILRDKELITSKMESQLKEAELNVLKSQINPHFLFNALNSAASLTLSKPEAARNMIVSIANFFRISLTAGKQPFVSLEEEIENSVLYLDIEKGRFGEKIDFELNYPEEAKYFAIPSMLLQPLIENCVKHGVYESSIPIRITLNIHIVDDFYTITLCNTIDPEASPYRKGTGTGLKNVSSRLELIYQQGGLIQSEKFDNRFQVSITLPKTLLS